MEAVFWLWNFISMTKMYSLFSLTFLLIATAFYIPNSGGSGVELPYNLMTICAVGIFFIILAYKLCYLGMRFRYKEIIVGSIILAMPWLLHHKNSLGVFIFLGCILIWCLLDKVFINDYCKKIIICIIFSLSCFQAMLALFQTFCPSLAMHFYEYNWIQNHGRPYGIFQQLNLLASFIATGIGCGILLFFNSEKKSNKIWLLIALSIQVFVLALNQSRTGLIGTVFIMVLQILIYKKKPSNIFVLLVVLSLSYSYGMYIVNHLTIIVEGKPFLLARAYDASTTQRWKILVATIQLIMQKPWFGWGYGTFEYTFSRYIIAHPAFNFASRLEISHPHNELLFQWYQGGIIPVFGLLTLFWGWIKIIYANFKESSYNTGYSLLIIPLLVHLNLEYPFYQSTVHLLLFIVVLRVGLVEKEIVSQKVNVSQRIVIFSFGMIVFSYGFVALCANHFLTKYEREHLASFPDDPPLYFYTQPERTHFDEMVALLVHYNSTHNLNYLRQFMIEASQYSKIHNDKNIWWSMIEIDNFQHHPTMAAQKQAMFIKLFPETTFSLATHVD